MRRHPPSPPRPRARLLLAVLVLLPAAVAADRLPEREVPATGETDDELWYRIEIDGEPCGWMRTRETGSGGHLTSESTVHLRLRRGAAVQEIETASGTVETADGQPVRAWARQRLGSAGTSAPIETDYRFLSDAVLVTIRRDGSESIERRARPAGDWLMPGRAQAEVRRLLASGAQSFRLRVLDPELGIEPIEIDWVLEEHGVEIEAAGRGYLTHRFRQTATFAPELSSEVYLTDDGLSVRTSMPFLGVRMTVTLAPREAALAALAAPELMTPTLLRPDRPIAAPRRVRRAAYELAVDDGEIPALPATGRQTVTADGRRVRIVVDLDALPAAGAAESEHLRSSVFIDHENPAIRRLLDEATRGAGAGPADRAEAMRAFVGDYLLDKSLELLLATASEVAQRRAGDCTEHSVLLAALLRADGIPARLAAGVVYVGELLGERDIFGYHMWAQAHIDDRWIDLDSSFEAPFDATHIAFATTALSDSATAARDLAPVAPLIGRARIRVLEVAHTTR